MITKNAQDKSLAAAIGRIPSGLFILTAACEKQRTGMLASWVQQVGFKPPMVSVAIAHERPITELIGVSGQFGLCQLAANDKVLLGKFARGIEPHEDPFVDFELVPDTSVPILTDALSYLQCEMVSQVDVETDHTLVIGRVVGGRSQSDDEPFVHIRDNGFKY